MRKKWSRMTTNYDPIEAGNMSDPVMKRRPMIDLENSMLVSHHGGVADGEIRSWRPLFIIVVIVATFAAAMAEIALSLATIKAENGPAKLQTEAKTGADVPARDAAVLSKPPGPPPMALVNTAEQPVDSPQAEEKAPPFGSFPTLTDIGPPAVAVPAQTQTLAEPLSTSAPIDPEKMKTDLVQSDAAPLPNVTLPQANVMGVPLPPPRPAAAATAPAPKIAVRVAKTAKPAAARLSGGHDQPRQIVKKAKAKPASPLNTEPGLRLANKSIRAGTSQKKPIITEKTHDLEISR
jgi:hypothetical protein